MDEAWERRIREREEEDAEDEASEAAAAAALLDEEPIPEMLTLMQRTASHLASASNPAQLEMRILANHGNDERFSFMREGGRSRNVWLRIKAEAVEKVKKAKEAEEKEKQKKRGLGMGVLAGYDSEDESGSEGEEAPPPPPPPPEDEAPAPPPPPPPANVPDKEALKAARREKARQWLEERKKSGTNS
ncbi:hypothetical protein CC2G_004731 [Coprinopsis cinerea AmutBmut pab1-1]|nr:hypothetical protein CC2G_004731 [Coprinopsis cinerea AmutBmut pab1-1]